MNSQKRNIFRAVLVSFFFAVSASAQVNTGAISGYVLDPSGRAIPNALVTLESKMQAFTRTTKTDNAGLYDFDGLAPADYRLSVSVKGFAPLKVEPVHVEVDARVHFNLETTLATRGERIVVDARTPALSTETSELGGVVSQELINDLPLNERDFLQLAFLLPGIAPPVEGSQLSTRGTFAMHANGGREEDNNFLLDGVDNNDSDTRGYTLQPSVDAIQEFKISTSTYSAEYGTGSAGQVNIITRSGSNQFHGTLYDYLRNRDLDARNYFDGSEKPQFIRNQFGGGLGGPVIRNSTFFYANYERTTTEPRFDATRDCADAGREGRGSFVCGRSERPIHWAAVSKRRYSHVAHFTLCGQRFGAFPAAESSRKFGKLPSNPIGTDRQNEGSIRVDRRLSESSQVTLRYTYGRRDLFEPFAENQTELPGFGDYVFDRGHNALINYEKTLNPRTTNTVILGFDRTIRQVFAQNYNVNVNQLWGVDYLPTVPRDFGFPGISVSGYSRVGDVATLPIDRADNTYQVGDNLTLVRGAHSIKVGGGLRDLQLNGYIEVFARGQVDFTGMLSGSGIGDLLLGLPTLGIHSQYTGPQTLRSKSWSGYIQDDWKVERNLTLNLGVRYEYDSPATDPTNRMATFDLQTGTTVQVGTNGIPRSGIESQWVRFQPTGGICVVAVGAHCVRGGYGTYYDSGMFVVNSSLYYNPPYFTTSVFFSSATSLITLANPFATANGFVPPAALSFVDPHFKPAYAQDWNFNIQRDVANVGVFSVAYVGSKGTHLPRSLDINQPFSGSAPLCIARALSGVQQHFDDGERRQFGIPVLTGFL